MGHAVVLLKRFNLNGHTIGFCQQTQKSLNYITCFWELKGSSTVAFLNSVASLLSSGGQMLLVSCTYTWMLKVILQLLWFCITTLCDWL